jgi:peptidoglycan LD-endopeptidase CwlK
MAADLNLLVPDFRSKVDLVLAECLKRGHELRPFFTLRSLASQAQLWRQSRSSEEIAAKVAVMKAASPWLANILASQPPTHGKWATNALPGQSWHQFGEAVDCFVFKNGSAIWDASHPGYVNYALIAQDHGLTAGRFWKGNDSDPPHVQLRKDSSPLHIMSWTQIEAEMRKRFPND